MEKEKKPIIEELSLLNPITSTFMDLYPRFSSKYLLEVSGIKYDDSIKPKVYDKKNFKNGVFTARNLEKLGFKYIEIFNEFRYEDIEISTDRIEFIDDYYSQTLNITTIKELKQFIKFWYGTNN